ncbi:MAG: hypothetical protein MZV64_09260 [Ignavibacteriales bacterium]|nr:hypothetical protein [Ignavibacteriales bacterium]
MNIPILFEDDSSWLRTSPRACFPPRTAGTRTCRPWPRPSCPRGGAGSGRCTAWTRTPRGSSCWPGARRPTGRCPGPSSPGPCPRSTGP